MAAKQGATWGLLGHQSRGQPGDCWDIKAGGSLGTAGTSKQGAAWGPKQGAAWGLLGHQSRGQPGDQNRGQPGDCWDIKAGGSCLDTFAT